ncbi:MAG: hydroxyacylglutathione hydrolase [Candidatus Binatia bacterium]|nr:MAG: hydroxyacylglutathione hydrolase [Candidatus Binatia bacterium]
MKVVPVPQLVDNYAYLVVDESTGKAAVVDCAEAGPVLDAVRREGVELVSILPTHHHYDHVGGNQDLLRECPGLEVVGYRGEGHRIPGCNREVGEGETVRVGNLEARVLFIPAHTSGHIAYYFEKEKSVFTGDTLFAGGCGRLFEGDAAMMIASLSKLMALPDDTRVYFGHEYTEKNLRFALTLEPDNEALRRKHAWALEQQKQGRPTTPTTIGSEKETNPFFRWRSPELRRNLAARFPDLPMTDVAVFAKTRELKDRF